MLYCTSQFVVWMIVRNSMWRVVRVKHPHPNVPRLINPAQTLNKCKFNYHATFNQTETTQLRRPEINKSINIDMRKILSLSTKRKFLHFKCTSEFRDSSKNQIEFQNSWYFLIKVYSITPFYKDEVITEGWKSNCKTQETSFIKYPRVRELY